ncbi:NCS1 family nucleobase:cation symporter-1 [Ferruginibacter lapsinanis]|uniref:NCS1 family nucleobase:cation symporter-1 n=1 Tax=Ferruginibacter lapsinanis TaxID=563172 RepID=UPI001E5245CF|nr:NCS1 family nucleobase:cation symporter-1 [Ferruginibacter lapsinanis]UEG50253.1 NCS1 family nucleobase:cation symporter-1 [Ferruginibacter lapsinanis]
MQENTNITSSSLYNEDLAPVLPNQRKWGTWNYAALWISMSLCIPTYMLASSLIEGGMNWWQSILTIFIANTIVLIPMILNGHAGAKYGIPFPVLARASFGTSGANIPAILRAIVACGWFGIQTWIGGKAVYYLIRVWFPSMSETLVTGILPDIIPFACFFAFWLLNMLVVYLGVESIRKLLVFKAFFLPLAALALLLWAISAADGLGAILSQPSKFADTGSFFKFFFPALTGMVGFWATLSLNIPDFTRYAKSQKAQINGQALGLPTSMTFFAFVGVVVTSATTIVFGTTIWDPVVLAGKFDSKVIVSFAMIAIAISTLATNIAANIVSPANDFANLAPSKINFKVGGFITGIIGLLIFPWKLAEDPSGYIFTWLVGYSSLLGPIGGIMISDYYFVKKQQLNVADLYNPKGQYSFSNGFNRNAVIALLAGILPNVPGFLLQIKVISATAFPEWISHLYSYAWFVGFFVSGVVYLLLMKKK